METYILGIDLLLAFIAIVIFGCSIAINVNISSISDSIKDLANEISKLKHR